MDKNNMNKHVDVFYDFVDKACMAIYDDIHLDYLESFIIVSNAITRITNEDVDLMDNSFYDKRLSSKCVKKLAKIYLDLEQYEFRSEEVRLATELILIKGFKARNLLLDFVTPDTINYLFSYIINSIIRYNKDFSNLENIRIMDTVLGTGNLVQTIINNSEANISACGIEHDELLVHIAKSFNDLLDNELVINYQNALDDNYNNCDIVIGDFGESKELYDIILKRLDNLDDGYFIYLINNDFFEKASEDFKKKLISVSTLIGLIVLPKNFVANGHVGKSILIGKKEVLTDYRLGVIQIDEDFSQENINSTFNKIDKMINKINKLEEN